MYSQISKVRPGGKLGFFPSLIYDVLDGVVLWILKRAGLPKDMRHVKKVVTGGRRGCENLLGPNFFLYTT